jgi:hypothetical protein
MAKRTIVTKSKAKAIRTPKRASAAKPKPARKVTVKPEKKTGVKVIKRKSPTKSAELATAVSAVESSVAEIKSQIGGFESLVSGLVKRLEADRKALESRLIGLLTDALSPLKAEILVPLQQEVSDRLDGFGRQLTELAKALEPGSGHR